MKSPLSHGFPMVFPWFPFRFDARGRSRPAPSPSHRRFVPRYLVESTLEAIFYGDVPLHRLQKKALYMVGTSNLGSWNGHWLYDIWSLCGFYMVFIWSLYGFYVVDICGFWMFLIYPICEPWCWYIKTCKTGCFFLGQMLVNIPDMEHMGMVLYCLIWFYNL